MEWVTVLTNVISNVGFPIVMCGALCVYIYVVQTKLQDMVNENTKAIEKLIDRLEDLQKK